jgi:hypothetical protein
MIEGEVCPRDPKNGESGSKTAKKQALIQKSQDPHQIDLQNKRKS